MMARCVRNVEIKSKGEHEMKPEVLKMINRAALCLQMRTRDFRIPPEPDADQQVTLRFRTARGDVDGVYYGKWPEDGETAVEGVQ